MCQLVRLERIKQSTIAVPPPHDRRVIGAPHGPLRPRPPPWPDNIIGRARQGDHRTPLERWVDFHFTWEGHFYG